MEYYISLIGIILLLFSLYNNNNDSIIIGIIIRWTRWALISLLVPYIILQIGWAQINYWRFCTICFLSWFLLESLYNWFAIKALSFSEVSLFPQYREMDKGGSWPTDNRFRKTKSWLQNNGFILEKSLFTPITDLLRLRCLIYQNLEKTIRLQIFFFPFRKKTIAMSISFQSVCSSQETIMTDNLSIPFGGYFPEKWTLNRFPKIRSIQSIYKKHQSILKKLNKQGKVFQDDALTYINQQQIELESCNEKNGFLVNRNDRNAHGQLTDEGRYRVWREIWFLSYLGISLS